MTIKRATSTKTTAKRPARRRRTAEPAPFGRPREVSAKVVDDVVKQLRAGMPIKVAARLAGIAESTYHEWNKTGEALIAGTYDGPALDAKKAQLLADFSERTRHAQAQAEATRVSELNTTDDAVRLRATQFALTHQYGWSEKQRVEVSGPNGGPIEGNVGLSVAELAALRRAAAEELAARGDDE